MTCCCQISHRRYPLLRQLVIAYKIAFKGVPMVVVIFLAYSFDSGQSDAALSLGYSGGQLFRRVMFPQIIVAAIPDLANAFMVIMKALSLAFAIEVVDIFAQAQLTAALNLYYLEAFLIAVVFYMVIAYVVTTIADKIEAMLRVRT